MIFAPKSSKDTSPEERRIMRQHWEWSGRYAMFWIIVTIVIFGGMFLLLDLVHAEDSVRTPSLILLATITVVNAMWRAVGVLAARIELMLSTRHGRDKP